MIGAFIVIGFIATVFEDTPTASPSFQGQVEAQQRAERLRQIQRASADSALRSTALDAVPRLAPDALTLVLLHGDSTKAPAVFAAARREAAKRQKVAERERLEQRYGRIRALAAGMTFDDGSRCQKATAQRIRRLMGQYPTWSDNDLTRVACGAVWIGQTATQLRSSWGEPKDINRTVTAYGTSEQWIYGEYGGPYVYLDDGVVKSWQN